jgi:hypothetical protein
VGYAEDVALLIGAHGIDAALHGMSAGALVSGTPGHSWPGSGDGSDVSLHWQVGQERLDPGFGGGRSPRDCMLWNRMNRTINATEDRSACRKSWCTRSTGCTSSRSRCVSPSRRVRHSRSPSWSPQLADKRHRAKMPENHINIAISWQKGKRINGWSHVSKSPTL